MTGPALQMTACGSIWGASVYSTYFMNRGEAYCANREYARAARDWKTTLTIRPKFHWARQRLAYLLATCPDQRLRDGGEAVKHATVACELSSWKETSDFHVLAAAYAEKGQFESAVEWQTKANELTTNGEERQVGLSRLELYKQGKPLREQPNSVEPGATRLDD